MYIYINIGTKQFFKHGNLRYSKLMNVLVYCTTKKKGMTMIKNHPVCKCK